MLIIQSRNVALEMLPREKLGLFQKTENFKYFVLFSFYSKHIQTTSGSDPDKPFAPAMFYLSFTSFVVCRLCEALKHAKLR